MWCIDDNGCDGVLHSGLRWDLCGVCDGDGSSCIGCDGVEGSGLEIDDCGVCGGDSTSCEGTYTAQNTMHRTAVTLLLWGGNTITIFTRKTV
jgi:hypothetical protein